MVLRPESMDYRAETNLNKHILLDDTVELKDLESDGTTSRIHEHIDWRPKSLPVLNSTHAAFLAPSTKQYKNVFIHGDGERFLMIFDRVN